jgi:hypothetical protein
LISSLIERFTERVNNRIREEFRGYSISTLLHGVGQNSILDDHFGDLDGQLLLNADSLVEFAIATNYTFSRRLSQQRRHENITTLLKREGK